jgi:hypothetical protein
MKKALYRGTMRLTLTVAVVAAVVLAWCAAGQAAEKPADLGPLAEKGDFQNQAVATAVSKLFQFKLSSKNIALNRDAWDDPDKKEEEGNNGQIQVRQILGNGRIQIQAGGIINANVSIGEDSGVGKAFSRVRSASGFNTSSESFGGPTGSSSFTGGKLSGKLEVTGDALSISLREESEPNRRIELTDNGTGGFRLLITDLNGDLVLVNQTAKGSVSVAAVLAGKPIAAKGASFVELYRNNRDLLEGRILPVLRHMGVDLPVSMQTPMVRQAALSRLTPPTDADTQRAQQLIKDLDDDSFEVREKATKDLIDGYDRFRPQIDAKAQTPNLAAEMADRLHKISAAHPDTAAAGRVIDAMNLLDDPEFLVGLLDGATDSQKTAVGARLEKLTGQKIGSDAAAWRKWLEQAPKKN